LRLLERPGRPWNGISALRAPTAWAAAIQIDLREMFGGIGYGKSYRPTYALVESGDKQVIVRIDDVGPLKPGRVIDFKEQTSLKD
jgi:rare lipoprotein A